MTTVFSKILQGEIPCEKVYENEQVLAFKDIHPKAPVHIVIIPKKEIPNLQSLESQDLPLLDAMIQAAQSIAKDLGIENGYRLVTNNGPQGGQEVEHLHFHLLGGRQLGSIC